MIFSERERWGTGGFEEAPEWPWGIVPDPITEPFPNDGAVPSLSIGEGRPVRELLFCGDCSDCCVDCVWSCGDD